MLNNFKLGLFPFVSAFVGLFSGCAISEDLGPEGQENASMNGSAMPNGIMPEELLPEVAHVIGQSALRLEKMSPDAIEVIVDPSPKGYLARGFLQYAIECALADGDVFEFSWNDSNGEQHEEAFMGKGRWAPAWTERALDVSEQQWVSACLAARTNRYGEHVNILMRAPSSALVVTDEETKLFAVEEGVFWGNLFGANPSLQSCYIETNLDYARELHRECATGHLENGAVMPCGMINITGPCSKVCNPLTTDGYHSACSWTADSMSSHVITVFLEQRH